MRKIANNTLGQVYMISDEYMINLTIMCMMCVMAIETAMHLVNATWIVQLTISLAIQKSVYLMKISRSTIQLLWGSRPANFGQLMLLICLKSHHRQMKFLHECNDVSN